MMSQSVLAMYDVRGIQKYIFRTAKVQDAVGASAIVEDVILEALQYAVASMMPSPSMDGRWYGEEGPLPFEMGKAEVQVLFVGGGNAYAIFRDRGLCLEINKRMSAYVMKQTYSLQLAAAIVDCTGDYQKDYQRLHEEMNRTKADMIVSKPLGALPVMQIEVKTGYPLGRDGSTETRLKKKKNVSRLGEDRGERIFDNYVTKKGVDSTIAVVHIDGNNMGLRIREQIQGKQDYGEAVQTMRKLSFHINASFQQVFQEMADHFNRDAVKGETYFVRKILVAGDDITYVCNGQIVLATIEYFCRRVSGLTMTGDASGGRESRNDNYGGNRGGDFHNNNRGGDRGGVSHNNNRGGDRRGGSHNNNRGDDRGGGFRNNNRGDDRREGSRNNNRDGSRGGGFRSDNQGGGSRNNSRGGSSGQGQR